MDRTEFQQRVAKLSHPTATDRRIIDYFDKHFLSIPYGKLVDICVEINIAKSTLGRFLIKIGFNGFQDFKKAILQPALRKNISPIERFAIKSTRSDGTGFIERYFAQTTANLHGTLEKIDKTALEKAIDLICDPNKKLYIIGSATAHSLAEYFYLLGRYIKKDIVLLDANIANLPHKLVDSQPGDVLLAISYYRFSSVTTRLIRWFHQHRGETVVITDRAVNPFSHFASALLIMESQRSGLFNSRSSGFVLIEALVNFMGEIMGKDLAHNFQVMESLFDEFNVFNK